MSGLIPKSFISNLLERVDIVDVINQRLTLKKKGTNHSACCPFHNEKTPSFSVNQKKQFYHCFGCGVSGDVIAFLMEFDRLSFVEAVEQLAKSVGLEVPYEAGNRPQELQTKADIFQLMEKIAAYYQTQLAKTAIAQSYLQQRGLSLEIIKKYQIGYAPQSWHQVEAVGGNHPSHSQLLIDAGMLIPKDNGQAYDRFRHRIMFPIRNRRGNIIGFGGRSLGDENPKYLNSPETTLFHKGHELYGLFEAQTAIRDAKQIIVVEGYMDTVALSQYDIPYVVATLGTAATPEHVKLLLKYAEHIIFCFDGDNAGRKAAWRALENSLAFVHENVKITFCFLPDNEDPDSFLHRFGREKFLALTETALTLSEFLIQHLAVGIDLGTVDGKNQLAQQAKPLIQKLKPGVYQQLLVQQLAKIIRMEEQTLNQIMGLSRDNPPTGKYKKNISTQTQAAPSLMRMVITLLLQYPELAAQVPNPQDFAKLNLPGKELFIEMVEFAKARPNINTAGILQHFNEHPQGHTLKKLATRELFHVENGLSQEFLDILTRLQKNCREDEMEQLLGKASLTGLTPDDRIRLQALISEHHKV